MSRRTAFGPASLAVCLAALIAALIPIGSARAALPVAGGKYVGDCCGGDEAFFDGYAIVAELRIGSDGRTLVGGRRGSYIACYQDGLPLVPLRPRQAVRIEREGTFSYSGRVRPVPSWARQRLLRLKVRGRFTSPDAARIVYSVRPARAGDNSEVFGCKLGPRPLRLHRAAGDPPFNGCASQPGTTVVSSAEARVFEQRRVFDRAWSFLPYTYGCLYSSNQRVVLGLDGFAHVGVGQALDNFRLAGPYVAYGCGGNLPDRLGCGAAVDVVDLRDGSRRRTIPKIYYHDWERAFGPADVELKPNGSVAWISGREGEPSEVGALDTNGQRQLDSGTGIDPESLTLTGSTLSWRNGTELRSATLD